MKKELKILIVDDHPMIVEAYKNILTSAKLNDYNILIDSANDCDTAIVKIEDSAKNSHYDMLFLDIKLPPSGNGEIISGEDLAIFAKELLPKAKIVILTMFNESFRILNIIKEINPEGLLIKSDLTSSELAEAFQHILMHPPYYSSTVSYFLKTTVSSDMYLDEVNRKILHLLSLSRIKHYFISLMKIQY